MSESVKNNDAEKEIDPIDEVLTIETPVVNDSLAGKKKKNPIVKYGAIGFVGVMGAVFAFQTLNGAPEKQSATGVAQVKTNDVTSFVPAPASARPLNPEAIEIAEKKEKERAAAAEKDPKASFVSVDPFGESKLPNSAAKQDIPPPPPMVMMPPQQPVPPQPVQSNGQEDPAITFARKVHADAVLSPTPGFTPPSPAQGMQVATATGTQGAAATKAAAVQDATVAAGEIKYALLTSGLNTRVPQTPPRAVIHGGPLDGGVLLGIMENADNQFMVLRFKSLTLGKKTYPIEAIAVNPDLQDAGLADEVNSHLLQKTAIQAGIGFIQAFGAAKLQEGVTQSTSMGYGGSTTYTQTPQRTNKQTAMIAAGGAAQAIAPSIDQAVNSIKPEVIIHPNKEMGILFLKSLYLP